MANTKKPMDLAQKGTGRKIGLEEYIPAQKIVGNVNVDVTIDDEETIVTNAYAPEDIDFLFDSMMELSKSGRPPAFKDPELFSERLKQFFKHRVQRYEDQDGNTVGYRFIGTCTMSALAVYLGVSVHTVENYESGMYGNEYLEQITAAKAICEDYCQNGLFELKNPRGAEFLLRTAYGKTEARGLSDHIASKNIVRTPEELAQLRALIEEGIVDE